MELNKKRFGISNYGSVRFTGGVVGFNGDVRFNGDVVGLCWAIRWRVVDKEKEKGELYVRTYCHLHEVITKYVPSIQTNFNKHECNTNQGNDTNRIIQGIIQGNDTNRTV